MKKLLLLFAFLTSFSSVAGEMTHTDCPYINNDPQEMGTELDITTSTDSGQTEAK